MPSRPVQLAGLSLEPVCQWGYLTASDSTSVGGGGSTKPLKRETVKRGEGGNHTKVAGTDSVTALVTKIKLISGEERLLWCLVVLPVLRSSPQPVDLNEGVTTNTLNRAA